MLTEREDASLEVTKSVVRNKLKLPAHEDIALARIEDGRKIDLEDGERML